VPILWFSQTELPTAAQQRMMLGSRFRFISPVPELVDQRGYGLRPGFHIYLIGITGADASFTHSSHC
jgi:hypothetical protein